MLPQNLGLRRELLIKDLGVKAQLLNVSNNLGGFIKWALNSDRRFVLDKSYTTKKNALSLARRLGEALSI